MSELQDLESHLREARERFLRAVDGVRPSLHKYCARMTGSVFDGEDVVQETLAQAYYKLSMLKQDLPLRPWLFKIAHNKCIDFLRGRRVHVEWTEGYDDPVSGPPEAHDQVEAQQIAVEAWRSLVTLLPPRERACVILKDILDQSLAEIAETLDASLTSVKAALHRGRHKLRSHQGADLPTRTSTDSDKLSRYVALFNKRDWDGIKALLTADTQCEVVGAFSGRGRDIIAGNYLRTLAGLEQWKMSCEHVEHEEIIVRWRRDGDDWKARGLTRIEWAGEFVARIRDYSHVGYLCDELQLQPKDEQA